MRLILALSLVLDGCTASAEMTEEARPFADDALKSARGLQRYLLASGVEIGSAYRVVHDEQPGLVRVIGFRFANGGNCSVWTYESPNVARQRGPETEGGYYSRSMPSGGFSTTRQDYAPTLQFGPNVAVCRREDARFKRALKALAAYAEANPAPPQSREE